MLREPHLIKGKVENLRVTHGYDNFVFSQNSQRAAGAGAAVGVVMGSFFNASAIANAGINSREKVEFFNCTVDGLPLAGRFKKVSFKDGDELDFVIEYTSNEKEAAIAHAVRDTQQRLLWVVPEQERGTIAKKKDNIWMAKMLAGFIAIIAFFASIMAAFAIGFDDPLAWVIIPATTIGMGGGAFIMGVLTTEFMVKRARIANKIIATLGYDNPEEVDLLKNEREINERLTKENRFVDYPLDVIRYGEPPSTT